MRPSGELKKTVLVVDDDADIREAVADLLEDAGYFVLEAGDGHQALARLDSLHGEPCLVLLDMMMPNMNGAELLEALSNGQRLGALPVVVMSANTTDASGARRVLRKPVPVDALLRVVQEFCG
jgi:two-component system, chemotaxis family, chemotaxis protein CheY